MVAIRKKLDAIVLKVDRAAERLLTAPENLMEILSPKLEAWERERETLETQLQDAKNDERPADVNSDTNSVLAKAEAMRDELPRAKPARFRELLRQITPRINLRWAKHPDTSRIRRQYVLDRVEVIINSECVTAARQSSFGRAPENRQA